MKTMELHDTGKAQGANDGLLHELQDQIAALAQSVRSLETQLAEQAKTISALNAHLATPHGVPAAEAKAADTGISPELLLVIAAAVTSFLGKKVRIRSARLMQSPPEAISAWAQQGRVFVQASHNLRRG